jgi:hypothetical protein
MNKWTAAVALLLAAVLGGAYWVMSQKKQMALSQPAVMPADVDGGDDEFETDSELGDTDGALEGQDGSVSELPPPSNANPSDKSTSDPLISNDPIDTLEDPDEGNSGDQDTIVIEDKDGAPPVTATQEKKSNPGP